MELDTLDSKGKTSAVPCRTSATPSLACVLLHIALLSSLVSARFNLLVLKGNVMDASVTAELQLMHDAHGVGQCLHRAAGIRPSSTTNSMVTTGDGVRCSSTQSCYCPTLVGSRHARCCKLKQHLAGGQQTGSPECLPYPRFCWIPVS